MILNYSLNRLLLTMVLNSKTIKELKKIKELFNILLIHIKSCDRATNENLNREIRRFFPKGTKFDNVSEKKSKKFKIG